MEEKNEENTFLVLISIIIVGALMVYSNRSVSLFEFRILFFLFFVPVFAEFIFFRARWQSRFLRYTLFFHTSSFIIVTIGLYIRENEQLFFGLFFAGFLVIVLSYVLMESLSATNLIMKLFTASIAFWIVYSYFPLSRYLSIVFGAVAFFLSYIFFEIPGRAREPVRPQEESTEIPDVEEPLRSLKSMSPGAPTETEKIFCRREFTRITHELHQLDNAVGYALFSEYPQFKPSYDYIQSLYMKKADSFQRLIPQENLEQFKTTLNRCKAQLVKMQELEREWNTLKAELTHIKEHTREVNPEQVVTLKNRFIAFWEQAHTMVPEPEGAAFKRELITVTQSVLRYDKIKKEWTNLTRDVNELMARIKTADIDECNNVNKCFKTHLKSFERCIPPEKIEEIHQKIVYCQSRITVLQEWKRLANQVDVLVKDTANLKEEKVLTLEREFLSRINEFAAVVSPQDISWMKVTFRLCHSRLEEQGMSLP
jgi:hypothetical protein